MMQAKWATTLGVIRKQKCTCVRSSEQFREHHGRVRVLVTDKWTMGGKRLWMERADGLDAVWLDGRAM